MVQDFIHHQYDNINEASKNSNNSNNTNSNHSNPYKGQNWEYTYEAPATSK